MKKIILLIVLISFTGVLFAAPADTTWRTKTQSNGQTITYSLRGDEFLHWAISQDGHTLLYDALGDLVYATLDNEGNLIPSSTIASDNNNKKASFGTNLFFSKKQIELSQNMRKKRDEIPPEVLAQKTKANNGRKDGTKKMLVILVNFPAGQTTATKTRTTDVEKDVAGTTTTTDANGITTTAVTTLNNDNTTTINYTYVNPTITISNDNKTTWNNQFNSLNYTTNGATGSVRDYYRDNTNNEMDIQFDLVGPYTMDHPLSYYGSDANGIDNGEHVVEFAREAIDKMVNHTVTTNLPAVTLANYANSTHWINNIVILYAGIGQLEGGGTNSIWDHQYVLVTNDNTIQNNNIYPNYLQNNITYHFCRYACASERNSTTIAGIGYITHEIGHLLCLPDVYQVGKEQNAATAVTPSYWDLMDFGEYNNSAKTPPYLSILERTLLKWDVFQDIYDNTTRPTITTLSSSQSNLALQPLWSSNTAYKIPLSNNEYLLLENRRKNNWDYYLPGEGMIAFHVDQNKIDLWVNTNGGTSEVNKYANDRGYYIEPANGYNNNSSYVNVSTAPYPGTGNVTSKTNFAINNGSSLNKRIDNIVENTTTGNITFNYYSNILNIINITNNSITVQWDSSYNSGNSGTKWDISYQTSTSENINNGTKITNIYKSPYTITGLTQNTAYSFAVTRHTDDYTNSTWTGIACAYTNMEGMKGAGTESNPYQIAYKEDLLALSKYIANGNGDKTEGKYFVLTRDIYFPTETTNDTITLDGTDNTTKSNFIPIGGVNKVISGTNTFYTNNNNKAYCFQGVFDGKGYTIHNLRVKRNTSCATGNEDKVTTCAMFGRIFNATIQNLSIVDGTFTGYSNVSAFVGSIDHNYSSDNTESTNYISSCVAIDNTLTAYKNCAGFVGYSENDKTKNICYIYNVYSTSNINVEGSLADYSTFAPIANTNNSSNAFNMSGYNLWRLNWITIVPEQSQYSSTMHYNTTDDNDFKTYASTLLNYYNSCGASFYYDNVSPFQVNKGFILPYKSPTSYTISNNTTFTLNNTSTATPKIIIEDGSSFINNTMQTFNGIVERKVKANKWNMYGDCLSSDLTAEVLNNNLSLSKNKLDMVALKWNNTTNNWSTSYVNSLSAPIYKDSAILIYPLQSVYVNNDISVTDNSTTTTMTQEGTLFNTDRDISVSIGGNSSGSGATTGHWAMLSNPYPAKLYISKFLQDNTTQGQGVYILNSNGTNYSFVNGNTATIDKMDGFAINVIQSSSKTVSQTFNFNKTQLVEASSKQTNNITPLCDMMTFITNNGGNLCQAYLNINPQAKNSFDIWDAYRMANSDTSIVTPYFVIGDKEIMKNEIKTLPYECGIDFLANKTSNISFYAKNIPNDVEVYLVDTVNNIETSLNNNNICQLLLNEGSNKDKYIIRFAPNTSLNDTLNKEDLEVSLYPNPANTQTTLNVEGLKEKAIVVINDVAAREIYRTTITPKDSSLKISTKSFAAGVYYIKVVTSLSTKTQKLIVK